MCVGTVASIVYSLHIPQQLIVHDCDLFVSELTYAVLWIVSSQCNLQGQASKTQIRHAIEYAVAHTQQSYMLQFKTSRCDLDMSV